MIIITDTTKGFVHLTRTTGRVCAVGLVATKGASSDNGSECRAPLVSTPDNWLEANK